MATPEAVGCIYAVFIGIMRKQSPILQLLPDSGLFIFERLVSVLLPLSWHSELAASFSLSGFSLATRVLIVGQYVLPKNPQ